MIEDRELLLWPFPHQCHDCISNYITWMWHYNLEDDNGSHLKEKKNLFKNFEESHMPTKTWLFCSTQSLFCQRSMANLTSKCTEILAFSSSFRSLTHSCCLGLRCCTWRNSVLFPEMRYLCSSELNESDLMLEKNFFWHRLGKRE